MALDPDLKRRVEEWWASKTAPAPGRACPGCGCSGPPHAVSELAADPPAVLIACEYCGHAYVFSLAALLNRLPP